MSLKSLTPDKLQAVISDLSEMGVSGSAKLSIPPFDRGANYHDFLRAFLLAFLRSLFMNLGEPDYTWDPASTKSRIQIGYADPRIVEEKGALPAITVELGPFTWGNHSINNVLHTSADGTTVYTDLRNGTAIIRCRSSVKLEADNLASIVSAAFHILHRELERLSGVVYLDAQTANPSSPDMSGTNPQGEFHVANVVVNIHYQESWKKAPTQRVVGKVVFVENPEGEYLQ